MNQYLSRKFVLSVSLAIIGTLFMWWTIIEPLHWQWLIMATVVSYVAANALQASRTPLVVAKKVPFWTRIKALFDRVFLAAAATVIVASAFLYGKIIPSSVWFTVCSAIAAAYNIGNSIAKRPEQ